MILPTLKRRLAWLRLPERTWLRGPLPWLILGALVAVLLGVTLVAYITLQQVFPDVRRYSGELGSPIRPNYGFWPFGSMLPPLNPEAIEAAEESVPPDNTVLDPGLVTPRPVVVVLAPSSTSTLEPPTATPTLTASPTPDLARAPPNQPGGPTVPVVVVAAPTRTPTVLLRRTPTSPPPLVASTRPTTAGSLTATTTPVTRPDGTSTPVVARPTATVTAATAVPPPPTRTAAVATGTSLATSVPEPSRTPLPPTRTTTPSPLPTATRTVEPTAPTVGFANTSLSATEASGSVIFEVRLSTTYFRSVTVRYTVSDGSARAGFDYRAITGTLIFNPGDLSKSLQVELLRDNLYEPAESFSLRLSEPTNARLNSAQVATVTLVNSDPPPTVRFVGSEQEVEESSGATSLQVELNQISAISVTLPYSINGSASQADHSLRNGTLVITAGVRSIDLELALVDDQFDEDDETVQIRLGTPTNATLGDPDLYVLTIIDDDTANLNFSRRDVTLTEGERGSYTVALNSRPTQPVTLTLSHDEQISVAPSSLFFDATNWNQPQTVAFTAINDDVDEPDHVSSISHRVSSADARYAALPVLPFTVRVLDNDQVGLVVSPDRLVLGENPAPEDPRLQQDFFNLRLNSRPTALVTVTLAADSQVDSEPQVLSFPPERWNVAQTVTVTAIDDQVDETSPHSSTISITSASVDSAYARSWPAFPLTIDDNDGAGFELLAPVTSFSEGGTISYTLRLNSQPVSPVRISLGLSPGSGLSLLPTTQLTFTAANWSVPQVVRVTATENFIADGTRTVTISHSVSSSDPIYSTQTPGALTVTVNDNDTAGIERIVTRTSFSEGNALTYTIRLTSQPIAGVNISLAEAPTGVLSPPLNSPLRFTALNWNVPQVVTVAAADNFVAEGTRVVAIAHSVASSDPNYGARSLAPVTISILDNDSVGLVSSPASLALSENPGALGAIRPQAASWDVRLKSQPTAAVTLTLTADSQVRVDPAVLVFAPERWNETRTVTVTALDDALDESSPHNSTFAVASSSSDSAYSRSWAAVPVTVEDDDTAGIAQLVGSTTFTEGNTISYTLRLTSQPRAPVRIALTAAPTGVISPALVTPLVFNALNWNVPQIVTVAVPDDFVAQGTRTVTVSHSVSSSDAGYAGQAVAAVTVRVADNDSVGLVSSPASLALSENPGALGATRPQAASWEVRLKSQPTAAVTLTLTADSQVRVDPAVLVFAPERWNETRTVTVTALDDALDESSPHNSTFAVASSSSDSAYSRSWAAVPVTVEDDDTAGIAQLVGSTTFTEGNTISYTLRLTSQPRAPVRIALTAAPTGVISPALVTPLVFNALNWNVPQTVTVAVPDDFIAQGTRTVTVSHSVSSTDAGYAGQAVDPVAVTVNDDDVAGVVRVVGSTSFTEGDSISYTLRLRSEPRAEVQIALSDTPTGVISPALVTPLVFNALNWNVPQTVTVAVPDDFIAQGTRSVTVSHAVSSTDAGYALQAVDPVAVTVNDNDLAGVVRVVGSTSFTEGNAISYTLRLRSEPTAEVRIALTDAPTGVISPALLTPLVFTAANWNVPQSVTVAVPDDFVAQGSRTVTVSHVVSSSDGGYAGQVVDPVTVRVNDDDVAGVVRVVGSTTITEGNAISYTLRLRSEPTAEVRIALTDAPTGVISPALLTPLVFTAANWNVPQSVTVAVPDDFVAQGSRTVTVSHVVSSSDGGYAGQVVDPVTVRVNDDDVAGVVRVVGSTTITEGNAISYTLRLRSEPTAEVRIALTDAPTGVISPALVTPLVFNALNWNVPQTVTVAVPDDFIAQGTRTVTVSHSVSSTDAGYAGQAVDPVAVTVNDDDVAGVVRVVGSTTITEGNAISYTLRLRSEPTAEVRIALTDAPTGVISPALVTPLVFNALNWNVPQTVTVAVPDDFIAQGTRSVTVSHSVSSTDAGYAGWPVAPVTVTVNDDDLAGVVRVVGSTTITEGDSISYTLRLRSEPTAPVRINLTNTPTGVISPALVTPLVFNALNWNVPQTVTVAVPDDFIAQGTRSVTVSHSVSSTDAGYAGWPVAPVTVTVNDDDLAGVVRVVGSTSFTEGDSISYTLRLRSEPIAPVRIALTDAPTGVISPALVTPLVFNALNWNVPQTVTVAVPDDFVAQGTRTVTVSHRVSSTDAGYAGWPVAPVTVTVNDDDLAGVVRVVGSTSFTEGDSISYTLRLRSEPIAPVRISLSDTPTGVISPALVTPLVFTAANWNVPQTVTVAVPDDFIAQGTRSVTVSHSVSSTDAGYAGWPVAPVTVTVNDDDLAGVVRVVGSTSFTEGDSISYTLRLRSEPIAPVRISLSDTPTGVISPALVTPLVFNALNWNVPQTVTVAVPDDFVAQGTRTVTVSHRVSSTDAGYAGWPVAPVTVTVNDDDLAGVVRVVGSTSFTEGDSISYTLRLRSEPIAPVRISLSDTPTGVISPALVTPLVFTAANWNVPQTVTVAVPDDFVAQGSRSVTVSHAVSSTDAGYAGWPVADVAVTVNDDDVAGVVRVVGSTSFTEGDSISYTLRLRSEPIAPVRIALTDAPTGVISPALVTPLVFTAANWNVPQTVTVAVPDDFVAQGSRSVTVSHAVSSTDAGYAGWPVADVAVTVNDDDLAGVVRNVTSLALSENSTAPGATRPQADLIELRLSSQPTAPVTLSFGLDTQVSSSPGAIVFDETTWALSQTITVSAVDDQVDETSPHSTTLSLSSTSADRAYNQTWDALTVTIEDDDSAGIVQTVTSTMLTEGTAISYTLRLRSEPRAEVQIALSDTPTGVISPALVTPLVFNALNWNVPQTVTVAVPDDFVAQGSRSVTVSHAVSSTDAGYAGWPVADVAVTVNDDDVAGVVRVVGSTTITEGNAISYTLRLRSEPTAEVRIALTDAPTGVISPALVTPLVFTAANWNVPQTVTVAVPDDFIAQGTRSVTVSHSVSSTDAGYAGWPVAPVTVTVNDDDLAGVVRVVGSTSFTEGDSISYTLRLRSEPRAEVQIALSDTPTGVISPALVTPLVFTAANWNVPQTVTVAVPDDFVAQGSRSVTVSHAVSSTDAGYAGWPVADVAVTVNDDDLAGVVRVVGSTSFTEGDSISYTLRLRSEPRAEVQIALSDTPTGVISPALVTPLVFNALNWNVPQTVTVAVPDDFVAQGSRSVTVSHRVSSTDAGYAEWPVAPVTVTVNDDDLAGVVRVVGSTTITEGDTISYTLRLRSEPRAEVQIALSDTPTGVISPALVTPLVFTAANWNVPQTVTVAVPDDFVAQGSRSVTVSHAVSSTDAGYAGWPVADVAVTVNDDDLAGVVRNVTSLALSENSTAPGATRPQADLIELRLSSQPTAPVTLSFGLDTQVSSSPGAIVFDETTWALSQTITVSAVDDQVDETSPHSTTLSLSSTSADRAYNQTWDALTVTIEDDDSAGIVQTVTSTMLTEGTAISYTLRLTSRPTATVTISLTADDQLLLEPAEPLRFFPATWDAPQSVLITATDNLLDDGDRETLITHTVSSADLLYQDWPLTDLRLTILDNDNPVEVRLGNAVATQEGPAASSFLMGFPVTLTRASAVTIELDLVTENRVVDGYGSATGGSDYAVTTSTLQIPPGAVTGTFEVQIYGDDAYEPDEVFGAWLSAVRATSDLVGVATGQDRALGVILNDDAPGLRFALAEVNVNENVGPLRLQVWLEAPLTTTVSVKYRTITLTPTEGISITSAVAGSDYWAVDETLTFLPNTTVQTVTLGIINDIIIETPAEELFGVELYAPVGVTLAVPKVITITVFDDDDPSSPMSPAPDEIRSSIRSTPSFAGQSGHLIAVPGPPSYFTRRRA